MSRSHDWLKDTLPQTRKLLDGLTPAQKSALDKDAEFTQARRAMEEM